LLAPRIAPRVRREVAIAPQRDRSESTLVLPVDARRRIEAWAAEGHPHEACGLLIGRVRAVRVVEVVDVRRTRNVARERPHERYELDAVEHLDAEQVARAAGLAVIGVWHSHPDRPARPSESDRAGAWPGWSYVIVSVGAAGAGDLHSWRLERDEFVEEAIAVV
jgi:proteasome lid subunit RPN8/RPN11